MRRGFCRRCSTATRNAFSREAAWKGGEVDLGLSGKVAVVGGASMGIGYGIARLLAAEGARVAVTARREAQLAKAAATIASGTGAEVLAVQADCRRADDCARVIDTVAA